MWCEVEKRHVRWTTGMLKDDMSEIKLWTKEQPDLQAWTLKGLHSTRHLLTEASDLGWREIVGNSRGLQGMTGWNYSRDRNYNAFTLEGRGNVSLGLPLEGGCGAWAKWGGLSRQLSPRRGLNSRIDAGCGFES